jgi:integrase
MKLSRGQCPKTINNALTILRKCLSTALEWGDLSVLPRIKFLKTIPAPFRFLNEDEVARLVTAAAPELWQTLILTACKTGLRFSELIALRWTDVDLVHRPAVLTVCRASVDGHVGATKNNRIRHVPLTSDVAAAVGALSRNGDLVFQMNRLEIKRECARWRLEQACARAGLPGIGWHGLRHSYASALARRGASLNAIRELLGHQTINMTLRYAHMIPSALNEAVALLECTSATEWASPGHQRGDTLALSSGPAPSTSPILRSIKRKTPRVTRCHSLVAPRGVEPDSGMITGANP